MTDIPTAPAPRKGLRGYRWVWIALSCSPRQSMLIRRARTTGERADDRYTAQSLP
ncbi:hypothetical protein [Parasphingorhabdus pacifica]